jgi:hypothetical protein
MANVKVLLKCNKCLENTLNGLYLCEGNEQIKTNTMLYTIHYTIDGYFYERLTRDIGDLEKLTTACKQYKMAGKDVTFPKVVYTI